jgi:purine-binding chemotaxis protein CheW
MEGDYIIVVINNNNFALSFEKIKEVVSLCDHKIHPVPLAKQELIGLVNLHGGIVVVMDLQKILNLGKVKVATESKLLVIEYEREDIALVVDDVAGVTNLSQVGISDDLEGLNSSLKRIAKGVALLDNNLVIVLDSNEFMKTLFDLA